MRSANQYLPSCLKGVCTEEVRSCHAMSDTYRDTEGNVNMFWNFGWAGLEGSANFALPNCASIDRKHSKAKVYLQNPYIGGNIGGSQ